MVRPLFRENEASDIIILFNAPTVCYLGRISTNSLYPCKFGLQCFPWTLSSGLEFVVRRGKSPITDTWSQQVRLLNCLWMLVKGVKRAHKA